MFWRWILTIDTLGSINFIRGDSWPIPLIIKGKTSGFPMDLTGYEVLMTVTSTKTPTDDTDEIFQCIGVVNPDQVNNKGRVVFTPTSENTALVGRYYYDIQISIGTLKKTFNAGRRFNIYQDNTKG